jgi:hypothetical protein
MGLREIKIASIVRFHHTINGKRQESERCQGAKIECKPKLKEQNVGRTSKAERNLLQPFPGLCIRTCNWRGELKKKQLG